MSVLAVIPCLNEVDHIELTLKQMKEDRCIDLIIVADGGSTDGSLKIIDEYTSSFDKIHLIHNIAKIQSTGINLAVKQYSQDFKWLLRIDAHCIYPDNYATTLLQAAKDQKADCVVVPMLTIGEDGFQGAVSAAQNSVLGTGGSSHRHDDNSRFVDHGHHALMKLNFFQKAGGYCEAMPCNEDAELDYRMTNHGAKIWLESNAAIKYFPRSTPKSLWIQYFRYGVGRACNLQRHRMRPRLRQVLPLAVPIATILLVITPIHWTFSVPLLTWLFICIIFGAVIGSRQGGKWKLLSGFAAAIMHLAWGLGFIWQFLSRPQGVKSQYGLENHKV